MKNWKTTASGIVSSAAGLVIALSQGGVQEPKWVLVTAAFVLAGGLAGMGITAKDATTHSTVEQVQESTKEADAK